MSQVLDSLISEIRKRKLTLGFAESCTVGLLSARLGRIAGVSDIFRGSVVSYANEIKISLLGVSLEKIRDEGAVSEAVASEMVRGACARLGVDCAIAVTGIAGPSGGTPLKPVGTVWFAVKGPGFEVSEKKVFAGNRQDVQNQSVDFALELLLRELSASRG